MKKFMIVVSVFLASIFAFENVMAEVSEMVSVNSNHHSVIEHINEDCTDVIDNDFNFRIDSFSHHLVVTNLYFEESQLQIWKPPVIS